MTAKPSDQFDGRSGALLGLKLSTVYYLAVLIFMSIDAGDITITQTYDQLFVILVIYAVVTIPSIAIGFITGWFLSNLIETYIYAFTRPKAFMVGLGFCLLLTSPIFIAVGSRLLDPTDEAFWTYTLWLSLPAAIFIFVGSLFAIKAYDSFPRISVSELME